MTYDERNPIVLPKEHRYSTILVIDAHRMVLHAGVRELRERYWILWGTRAGEEDAELCVTCQRFSAIPASAPVRPLLRTRTTQAEPFEVVGVDFAGPLYIQAKDVTHNSYITLLTCAVARVVHLEVVPDVSTRIFLVAARKFVSWGGTLPHHLLKQCANLQASLERPGRTSEDPTTLRSGESLRECDHRGAFYC